MEFPRQAGVLLHITSLPGPSGIGDLGPGAARFADFLAESGVKLWQILPLNPIGAGNCPYSSPSAFAGNPLLISLESLAEEGLIRRADFVRRPAFPSRRVDFPKVISYKSRLLKTAFDRFSRDARRKNCRRFESFKKKNAPWLEDYALFVSLKKRFKGKPWFQWPAPLRLREESVLERWREELAEDIGHVQFRQYLFFRQWARFRALVNGRGIRIIGDIPFFVNQDSADAWANSSLFLMDARGRRTALSGVPPPKGGKVGQIWGNPLYDWQEMKKDDFRWWRGRFGRVLSLVDIIRVDHFSGFHACWHIPTKNPSSRKGRWVKGPGAALFRRLQDGRGGALPIIAEALEAEIQKPVDRLMKEFAIPGVRELQFGLEGGPSGYHHPESIPRNSAFYTGLHDNDTSIGWFRHLNPKKQKKVLAVLGVGKRDVNWGMIRAVFDSVADTAVVPLQDVLDLGSSARMNVPGQARGQWGWRFEAGDLTGGLSRRLAELVSGTGR
ncbi:MAG: 4-alpha-glucanotransferase [PVC group bacterium]